MGLADWKQVNGRVSRANFKDYTANATTNFLDKQIEHEQRKAELEQKRQDLLNRQAKEDAFKVKEFNARQDQNTIVNQHNKDILKQQRDIADMNNLIAQQKVDNETNTTNANVTGKDLNNAAQSIKNGYLEDKEAATLDTVKLKNQALGAEVAVVTDANVIQAKKEHEGILNKLDKLKATKMTQEISQKASLFPSAQRLAKLKVKAQEVGLQQDVIDNAHKNTEWKTKYNPRQIEILQELSELNLEKERFDLDQAHTDSLHKNIKFNQDVSMRDYDIKIKEASSKLKILEADEAGSPEAVQARKDLMRLKVEAEQHALEVAKNTETRNQTQFDIDTDPEVIALEKQLTEAKLKEIQYKNKRDEIKANQADADYAETHTPEEVALRKKNRKLDYDIKLDMFTHGKERRKISENQSDIKFEAEFGKEISELKLKLKRLEVKKSDAEVKKMAADLGITEQEFRDKQEALRKAYEEEQIALETRHQQIQDGVDAINRPINIKDTRTVTIPDYDKEIVAGSKIDTYKEAKDISDAYMKQKEEIEASRNGISTMEELSDEEQGIKRKIDLLLSESGGKETGEIKAYKEKLVKKYSERVAPIEYVNNNYLDSTQTYVKSPAQEYYDAHTTTDKGLFFDSVHKDSEFDETEYQRLLDSEKNNKQLHAKTFTYDKIIQKDSTLHKEEDDVKAKLTALDNKTVAKVTSQDITKFGTKKVTQKVPIEEQIQQLDEIRKSAVIKAAPVSDMAIIGWVESNDKYDAKNPKSSALGKYQMTKATQITMAKRMGITVKELQTEANQEKAMKLLVKEYDSQLRSLGKPITTFNRYGIHQLGYPKYRDFVSGNITEGVKSSMLANMDSTYKFTTKEKLASDWSKEFKHRISFAKRLKQKQDRVNVPFLKRIEKKAVELEAKRKEKIKTDLANKKIEAANIKAKAAVTKALLNATAEQKLEAAKVYSYKDFQAAKLNWAKLGKDERKRATGSADKYPTYDVWRSNGIEKMLRDSKTLL